MDADARIAQLERENAELRAENAELRAENAELRAENAQLKARIAVLEEQVAQLLERLNQNSRNSHRPPSSDPPGTSAGKGKRRKPGRKRGGQRGHKGRHRELLPTDQADEVKHHYPDQCENCWADLPETPDPNPSRFQSIEIPPIKPRVTEHQYHAVGCGCGHTTRAKPSREVVGSPFGPRLMALVGLFVGVYHLSRRTAVELLGDVLGVKLSLGALSSIEARVSDAVEPAVDQAWKKARDAPVKHTDGTTWAQAGKGLALWTLATASVTVYKILADGSKKTLRGLFGQLKGILISDRAGALTFWVMERRQVCWAHLLRKFISFAERDGRAGELGSELLGLTGIMFEYWHDLKAGRLKREQFLAWMTPLQAHMESVLERAAAANIKRLSGACADILAHRSALWTFITHAGVEPTNNHAERELRAFVLWRKRCFGSNSLRGNLFAERIMTVARTAQKQGKNVLDFLTQCCEASRSGKPAPSLFTP